MCYIERPTVTINGMKFIVVDKNQTNAGTVLSYTEAVAKSKGETVASSS